MNTTKTTAMTWAELSAVLAPGADSSAALSALLASGGLAGFPELERLASSPEQLKYHPSGNTFRHCMIALRRVRDASLGVKFAVLVHDLGKGATPPEILPHHNCHDVRGLGLIRQACARMGVPAEAEEFALLFCKHHMRYAAIGAMAFKKRFDMVAEISRGFADRARLDDFQACFSADWHGEEIDTGFNGDEACRRIIAEAEAVFEAMQGFSPEKLSARQRLTLERNAGDKRERLLRDAKLKWLGQQVKAGLKQAPEP